MAFDITSVLKGAAAKTVQEQIVYLPLENLDPDPNNFYTIEDIDELAANIELIGLQQPIRVRPGADGRYIVVSGHRRRAACLLIRDGEDESRHMFDDGVPCIIDDDSCSDNMRQLRLIYANSATRDMSSADISKQAEQVEMLLYKLKEEDGIQFPGRMRDHVAQACKISKTKLARLHAIRNNLEPELLNQFDAGRLNESVAYRLSQEAPEVQKEISRKAGASVAGYDINTAERVIIQVKTPKPAEPVQKPEFDGRGHLAWDAEAYHAQRKSEDDDFREMLTDVAQPFLRELDSLASRQEGIERLKTKFGKTYTGHTGLRGEVCFQATPRGLSMHRSCSGKQDIARTWTEIYDVLCTIALDLASGWNKAAVSDSDTEPKWKTGRPPVSGLYAVKSGVPKEEGPQWTAKRILVWTGDAWVTNGPGVPISDNIYGWLKLPEG